MNDRNYVFYPVPDKEAVVVNSENDFELALVLKKKQQNRSIVIQTIDRIIEEKEAVFAASVGKKSICFVGHSQLDQWKIDIIAGYKVRNCAVSGISSFEYEEKILNLDKLKCTDDIFLVMHGTNDIVWDYTIDEIVESIRKTINYIKGRNVASPVFFLSCLHVNGRLDRSNTRIDELNNTLKNALGSCVIWIDTSFMDDKFGNLDEAYTKDGLHISDKGYEVLKTEIENTIKGMGF